MTNVHHTDYYVKFKVCFKQITFRKMKFYQFLNIPQYCQW